MTEQEQQDSPIPDFCRARAVLLLAFIIELVVIVLTLAGGADRGDVLPRFILLSLYLQWLGLCGAVVLCNARRWIGRTRAAIVFLGCWGALILLTLIISDVAYWVASEVYWDASLPLEPRAQFIFRNLCISAIVSLFLLRYFWVQNQWRSQVRAEAESRYQALQARIRPHFLFNSLNSIAALTTSQPAEAERLIEDLSELLRVSLDVRSRLVKLRDELEITRAYLRIEQVRLGERLQVVWDVPEELLDIGVPLLSVQPLAENAVYHGIARLVDPGSMTIRARREADELLVEIENPLPLEAAPAVRGFRMATDNIAQRLALIYGGRAKMELNEEAGIFVARLRLPVVLNP